MRRNTGSVTPAPVMALVVALVASLAAGTVANGVMARQQEQPKDGDRRPKLLLKANPIVGTAPARIVLTAELVGGADDFEEYYCASTQWQWGDDTSSESNADCPPYEAGKSQIKRRFTVEHIFRRPGNFRVFIHLKQRSKQVASAQTNLQIRPGVRDFQ